MQQVYGWWVHDRRVLVFIAAQGSRPPLGVLQILRYRIFSCVFVWKNMKIKTIRGKLRSSPSEECSYPYHPWRGNGIFLMNIRAPYTTAATIPNWTQTSRNVIHFGLDLSNFGVNLSINLDTRNANMKHATPTHATPKVRTRSWLILCVLKKIMLVREGDTVPQKALLA